MTEIVGIGPSFAKKLVKHKIYNINDLKKAYNKGRVKLTNTQLLGIKYNTDLKERIPRKEIDSFKKTLQKITKSIDPKLSFEIMGSYRRGLPSSGDIDVLIYHLDKQRLLRFGSSR